MFDKRAQILREQELLKFKNYEEYLDSYITPRDLYHLRSKSVARQIIELGYHTEGILERDTFYKRVIAIKRQLFLYENPYALCSESVDPDDLLLQELAYRENANRIGELYTIIFIRHSGKAQSQISGYIDYSDRLKSEDWLPYFDGSKKIVPRKTDLAYYNWKSGTSILNESPNYKPLFSGKSGLAFENIHDSEMIFVDPTLTVTSDPARTIIHSEVYGRAILYDHCVPRMEYA